MARDESETYLQKAKFGIWRNERDWYTYAVHTYHALLTVLRIYLDSKELHICTRHSRCKYMFLWKYPTLMNSIHSPRAWELLVRYHELQNAAGNRFTRWHAGSYSIKTGTITDGCLIRLSGRHLWSQFEAEKKETSANPFLLFLSARSLTVKAKTIEMSDSASKWLQRCLLSYLHSSHWVHHMQVNFE